MAGFTPVNHEEGKVELIPVANSVAVLKGAAMADNGSGLLDLATSSTAVDIEYVAAQTVTTTSSGQLVPMIPTKGVRFSVKCDAAPAQTDVGTRCDLATNSTVNPDAASNNLFYIEMIDISSGLGAVGTTTTVIGHFVEGAPNS